MSCTRVYIWAGSRVKVEARRNRASKRGGNNIGLERPGFLEFACRMGLGLKQR